VFGIAFLNKYSIAFFIVSFLVALLLTRHRILLKSPYFLIGGITGILIILPNLLWQYHHNWPLITHMAELQKYQFVHVSIVGFIIDQFMMNLPGLLVWIVGLILVLVKKSEKDHRVFALTYLFTLLIIIALHGKSYYTLGLYSILFALGGYVIEKYMNRVFKFITLALILVLALPMLPFSLPLLRFEKMEAYSYPSAQFTNRWEDGNVYAIPQDYADMTGWKELSSKVISFYNSLPQQAKDSCRIYAENYGQAGAVLFYGKSFGLPTPVSFSDNFLLWAPDSIGRGPLIYINDEIGDINKLFHNYQQIGEVNNKYFRENGLKIFYCTNPTPILPEFYARKVSELKSKYRIQK